MATSTIKTLGLIALVLLILFIFFNIAGIAFIGPRSFAHIWTIFTPFGNLINNGLGFPIPWFFSPLMPLALLVLWIAVILWVYRDAEQRNMNGVLWGLLVFVGNIIGLLIYLIVRNEETTRFRSSASTSIPASNLCPSCKRRVQPGFAYCPHCGAKMKAECRNCKKPVSDEWQLCPYCGEKLTHPASGEGI